jgi:hypothetical protein
VEPHHYSIYDSLPTFKRFKGTNTKRGMFNIGRQKLVDMWGLQVKRQDERCIAGWVTNELDSALLSLTG